MASASSLGECGSEYSVSYNHHLKQYLMVYVDSFNKTLWMRTADQRTGPFSTPLLIGRVPHESISELVFLAFEHPQFALDSGRQIMISYSQPYFILNALVEVAFS